LNTKLTLPAVVGATGGVLYGAPGTKTAPLSTLASFSSSYSPTLSSNNRSAGAVLDPAVRTLTFAKVVYDSREVTPGTLFVALPGEVTDGHNFISEAIAKGAAGCLVRQDWVAKQPELDLNVAWIAVEQTLPAFQKLAAWWRNQFTALDVIGITGSVGKTSTKELLSAVLSQRYITFKTPKSINTEQSLLPVLLNLNETHEVAVVEMGAGWGLGELTRLCNVAKPRIAVVLNVSHSHLERMGSLENIALNKSELPRAIPPADEGGIAVLNGDDERVRAMAQVTPGKPFFYGLQPEYDLWADNIESFGLDGIAFTAHYAGTEYRLRLPLLGRHSVYTALAAIAVGLLLNLEWDEIEAGLQDPSARIRLLVVPGINGTTIIDDSYNASAVSTVAALDLLNDTRTNGRKIAALGDMLELGSYAEEAHRVVGRRAAQVATVLVAVGKLGKIIGDEALASGMSAENVIFAENRENAAEILRNLLQPGDYLLVKASRGTRLDEVVAKLKAEQ
jgi:UDP-N-acetylmuramoyl-tripeptide--D-alanyl-D-alanine ligase